MPRHQIVECDVSPSVANDRSYITFDDTLSLDAPPPSVHVCRAGESETEPASSAALWNTSDVVVTVLIDDLQAGRIVEATRSDDPGRQPVEAGWLAGLCRASLQECATVVTLATRQIECDDESSREYCQLKELAARAMTLIAAGFSQVTSRTSLSRDTWSAMAKACQALAAEDDNFPFDGWVSQCAEGCRQLAADARRASVAGVEFAVCGSTRTQVLEFRQAATEH